MSKEYSPGDLRISEDRNKWTAEQWTGTHWLFLHWEETREELDKWITYDWKRHPIDRSASD